MAAGDKITNERIAAMFHICAELDMEDTSNTLIRTIQKQPDGIYAEANLNEMAIFLKWHMGRDNVIAKWHPAAVYETIIGKFVNFSYNKAEIGDMFKPPENAAGGVGEITCDADGYGSRNVLCFKWNPATFVWTEQDAGTLTTGWTFTEAAGEYALCFDDYAEQNSFCTKFLTVTE